MKSAVNRNVAFSPQAYRQELREAVPVHGSMPAQLQGPAATATIFSLVSVTLVEWREDKARSRHVLPSQQALSASQLYDSCRKQTMAY